jgi:tetratricopeptide (TPR) repeat protein
MDEELDQDRITQIRRQLENYPTEQLTEIWRQHNQQEWTPEAFEAIRQILTSRSPSGILPEKVGIGLAEDHLERAHAYAERDQLQDALREVDLALQKDPHSLEAYQYRGNLLEDLGDLEGAIKAYRQARYLDRSNESTRLDLRRALTKQFEEVARKRRPPEDDAEVLDEDELEDEMEEEPDEEQDAEADRIEFEQVETGESETIQPLSNSTLILLGLATTWVSIAFTIFGLMVYNHLQDFLSGVSTNLLQFASPSDRTIILFSGLLYLGLLVIYMRRLFNNDNISLSHLGLIGASLIFLPFISMPVYFYFYLWRVDPDDRI